MATEIWVNIGSGNGLLPDGTKPLPEPMLTDHHLKSSDIHIWIISQEMPQPSITKIVPYLKFHSNFPGANELTCAITHIGRWRTQPKTRTCACHHHVDDLGAYFTNSFFLFCISSKLLLTLNKLNCFKDYKDIFTFWVIYRIWLDPSRWN